MKEEVTSAVEFLTKLLRTRNVTEAQTHTFMSALVNILCNRYEDHWFPEKPFKGSGYRCIRLNHNMDPLILQAGQSCGLDYSFLEATFPPELTMWVDPQEVSYRIGENGSVGHIYNSQSSAKENEVKSVKPSQPSPPPPMSTYNYQPEYEYTNRNYLSCKEQFMNVMPSMSRDASQYQKFPSYVFS